MISHINLGVSDFERGFAFYSPVLHILQLELKYKENCKSWLAWQSPGQPGPLLIIGKPLNGAEASARNGRMIAFLAPDRASVRDPDGNKLCVSRHDPE